MSALFAFFLLLVPVINKVHTLSKYAITVKNTEELSNLICDRASDVYLLGGGNKIVEEMPVYADELDLYFDDESYTFNLSLKFENKTKSFSSHLSYPLYIEQGTLHKGRYKFIFTNEEDGVHLSAIKL